MNRLTVALTIGMGLLLNGGYNQPTSALAGAGKNAEIEIVGQYTYKSGIPGGEETGTVDIQKHGDTYKLEWVRDDKRGKYSGVAIRTGDTLSVSYSYPGAGERGVGAFKIMGGQKLAGQWAILGGDGKLFRDTWTPKK